MAIMWHHGEPEDGILQVRIDREDRPVNSFSQATLEELRDLLVHIRNNGNIRGVLFCSGKSGNFIAGADVTEMKDLEGEAAAREISQLGQKIFDQLATVKIPTVALISGACLGGGLEFAMACRYRLADESSKTKLGLPEVKLGLIPGWGGTVRLPRLIGVFDALPMILTGKMLNGFQARSKGLVHDVLPIEGLERAGRQIIDSGLPKSRGRKKPIWKRLINRFGLLQKYVLNQAEKRVRRETHGHYPAPFRAIESLRAQAESGPDAGYDVESNSIAALSQSPVTHELMRLFFLSEAAKKPPEDLDAVPDPAALTDAAVLGAGAMGAGIALLLAQKNVWTRLKEAAEQGQIHALKGFGKKTEESILEGLARAQESAGRVFLADAKVQADAIIKSLAKLPSVKQISDAGSLRRRRETVGDLDILITADDSKSPMDALAEHELVEKVLARGETKQRVRLRSGLEMDLRVVPEESYGAALQYFTGSKAHNIVIRRRAQERDLKINEYGVYRGDESVAGATEEEMYDAVDLPWIPPELREDRGEIEMAEKGELPELIELSDIRGDLHMHTTATDGTASIAEMAAAAKKRKLKYIAITDHSKRVTMARGLDAKRLRAHWKEIEKVNAATSGIEILKGIECDILEDATLDLPDDVLAEADWVIAVLHYGLKQPQEQIHKRLLAAIKNPHVNIIGHPTGRLIGKRPGAEMNMREILKAAADHGVMMEINAHPSRLDLDEIAAATAKELKIPIVISTDAHSVTGFDVMQYGIYQARRAGLEKKDVANTRTWGQFKKLLSK